MRKINFPLRNAEPHEASIHQISSHDFLENQNNNAACDIRLVGLPTTQSRGDVCLRENIEFRDNRQFSRIYQMTPGAFFRNQNHSLDNANNTMSNGFYRSLDEAHSHGYAYIDSLQNPNENCLYNRGLMEFDRNLDRFSKYGQCSERGTL